MKKKTLDEKTIHLSTLSDVELLKKIIVGIGEVAKITGIPQRQLRYWQAKGIIQTAPGSKTTRRFNFIEIKKILLIKELMDEGYTLDASANKVEQRMKLVHSVFKDVTKKSK